MKIDTKLCLNLSVSVLLACLLFTLGAVLVKVGGLTREIEATRKSSEEMALQVEITNSLISTDTARLKVTEYLHHHAPNLSPLQCVSIGGAIMEGVKLYQIPASLTLAVIQHESQYNPSAISPKGAIGLMQVLPVTALPYLREEGIHYTSIQTALLDPVTNIRVGLAYLDDLHTGMSPEPDYLYSLTAYNFGPVQAQALRANTPVGPVSLAYATSILKAQKSIAPEGIR